MEEYEKLKQIVESLKSEVPISVSTELNDLGMIDSKYTYFQEVQYKWYDKIVSISLGMDDDNYANSVIIRDVNNKDICISVRFHETIFTRKDMMNACKSFIKQRLNNE